jgi:hypothetical protein
MKVRVTSAPAVVVFAVAVCIGTSETAWADGLVANWTLNDGGTVGNTIAAGAPIADSSGNGFNGTVAGGSDTLKSVQGVIGNGLYFSGDNSANYSYISVPATLASGANLGGMDSLTISLWVNIPADSYNNTNKAAVDLYNTGDQCYYVGTTYPPGLPNSRGLVYGFDGPPLINDHPYTDSSGNHGFWARTDGTGWTANTWEQVTVEYYGGNASTAIGFMQYYVNGIFVTSGECGESTPPGGPKPVPAPSAGQDLVIGCANATATYNSDYTQMWYGGLNDIGIWQTNLAGAFSFATQINSGGGATPTGFTEGMPAGGEVGALYNTPMYNGHSGALSQYGVSAMDKLFTIYDSQSATPIGVTTSNGNLGWRYVPDGTLSGTSGYAGYNAATGLYFVQLDANGGGVETLLPGDANGDGRVDINDLTIVLANYNKAGLGWANGEFTGDGTVDINDLTIVLAHYGDSVGASASGLAAVPEPSAILLISGGLAALSACAWRRRK